MIQLDKSRIALAALALIDEHGFQAFTIRGVAEALGVTPMALYHHFKDKAALAASIVDIVTRERPLAPPTGSWRDDLWAVAQWLHAISVAHPAAADLGRAYMIWAPAMLDFTERWFSLWQQSGLPFDKALLAAKASGRAATGLVAEERASQEYVQPRVEALATLPNARAMIQSKQNSEELFELAVRSVIDGIYERLR